jgi:4-hydroxybenzoate polyprenyltransferase
MLLNVSVSLPILLIAYLIPLIVYSLNYYGELEKDADTNPERVALVSRKGKSYPIFIGLYVLTLMVLVYLYANISLIAFIVLLALSGLLYTVVFKNFTKKVPGLKNVYTSFVWAAGGTFFLVSYYSASISLAHLFIFIFMFTKSLVNVIFFDLKDMDADNRRGLRTIPVALGTEKTFMLLHTLNILAFVPLLVGVVAGEMPVFALSLLALYAYTSMYLRRAKGLEAREIRLASYTFAEAEIILWPVLLAAGRAVAFFL